MIWRGMAWRETEWMIYQREANVWLIDMLYVLNVYGPEPLFDTVNMLRFDLKGLVEGERTARSCLTSPVTVHNKKSLFYL